MYENQPDNIVILSVLMSVYYGEKPKYFRESLQSLAEQTRKADEVVLVLDGPIPNALMEHVDTYSEALNIQKVQLPENRGLAVALNEGLRHCRGEYIVRMDSDDHSVNSRFEQQLRFMIDHSDIAVSSGALMEFDDEDGSEFASRVLPTTHEELVVFAKLRSPINHAAAIFRKDAVLQVGGYPEFRRSQDVALWSKMIVEGYKLANISNTIYRVRANRDFQKRGGLKSLAYDLRVIAYQREVGFLTAFEATISMLLRTGLALMPVKLKRVIAAYVK